MLNVIDIASWQSGMNLATMYKQNKDLNGVIVKVTQGTSYINPPAKEWLEWLMANNKPFGVYHFIDLYGGKEEARHFVNNIQPYIGKGILVIDYEGNAVRKGAGYLKECLDEVYRLTSVKPFVYCSQSITQTNGFDQIAAAGYPLWMAQYADYNPVYGFLEKPWHKGSVSPFDKYWMHQYTSCGYLSGWNGRLDFDLFYGTLEDWNGFAKGERPEPIPVTPLKKADPSICLRVLKNEFGTGTERIMRLRDDEGYDPDDVQRTINRLFVEAGKAKAAIGDDMSYLNSILWIMKS